MPVKSEEGILVLTPAERNIYARFARILNSKKGICIANNEYYLDFLKENGIKHDTFKAICKVGYDYIDYDEIYIKFVNSKQVSQNGYFLLTKDGTGNVYGVEDYLLPKFDKREQEEKEKELKKRRKEQEKLNIEWKKAEIVKKEEQISETKQELVEWKQKQQYELISNPEYANMNTRANVSVRHAEKRIKRLEEERQDLIDSLPDEEKTMFLPKENKRKDTLGLWTKEDVVRLLTTEAHKVGRMLGAGYDLFEPIHGEWINRWLLNPSHAKIMVHQAHRGSFKSTCLRLFTAIYMILFPMKTVIIIRKSEDAVKELIQGVSAILDTALFHTFVNILHPDIQAKGGFKKTTDTALILDTNLNLSLSGEPQIRALGLGSSLTGKHSTMIITDDICFTAGTKIATPFGDKNIEDLKAGDEVISKSGKERKILKTSSRLAKVICRKDLRLCGTPEHPVYSVSQKKYVPLSDINEFDVLRINTEYPFIVDETMNNTYQTVYNIEVEEEHNYFANGILVHNCVDKDRESPAEREYTKAKYREMMNIMQDGKGFEDSWILNIGTPWHEEDVFNLMDKGLPEKTDEQLELEKIPQKKRTKEQNERIRRLNMLRGKFVYNCYQTGLMTQKDIDWKYKSLNDDALFAANYMLNLVSDDECPFPHINNIGNYSKAYFSEAWEVFAHIDCSYGGEDSTALSVGCHNWTTNETVVYGRIWHKIPIDENYLEIAEILVDCTTQTLFLETNADKGLMGQKFRELGFNVVSYHEHSNKDIKITSTIRPFWREKGDELLPSVQFVAETDTDYLAQIHDYKKGVRHDDAPDSLACLLLYSKFGSTSIRVT